MNGSRRYAPIAMTDAPLRLRIDDEALVHNWRQLDRLSGKAACGAAIKADGYGLGATHVAHVLATAGCCDFFVATWGEAEALLPMGLSLAVLHGVRDADMAIALQSSARPVLNTAQQVSRWRAEGGGRCDVMVDTGMNRLGVSEGEVREGVLDGLQIDTLMSHLACADEDVAMNARQRERFVALRGAVHAERYSLANSAGVALGADYAFDLTRPGLSLYGGVQRPNLVKMIRQVVWPEAEVLQRRRVRAGETVGYNATWRADKGTEVAIVNLGYADGYFRGFSNRGYATFGNVQLPVIGRVSMDLTALDVSAAASIAEGDWLRFDYALPDAARRSGMSQYELLTSLGARFSREPCNSPSPVCGA